MLAPTEKAKETKDQEKILQPPGSAGSSGRQSNERIINNKFKQFLSPRIVSKYESFKPKGKDLEDFDQINVDVDENGYP